MTTTELRADTLARALRADARRCWTARPRYDNARRVWNGLVDSPA